MILTVPPVALVTLPNVTKQSSLLSPSKKPFASAVKLTMIVCVASTSLITNGTSSTNAVKKKSYSLIFHP